MNFVDQWSSVVSRVFFGGAFLLLAISVLERGANTFGYTLIRRFYTAGRLLEFATLLLLFVIALLLREVREEMRRTTT